MATIGGLKLTTQTLDELFPLEGTTSEALDAVDIRTLSEGAALILLAHRLERKPRPADVLPLCLPPEEDPTPGESFYIMNKVKEGEFVYADAYNAGDRKKKKTRQRRYVARMRIAAEELANAAAQPSDDGALLDLAELSTFLKKRPLRSISRRPEQQSRNMVLDAIKEMTQGTAPCPTVKEVAERVGISKSQAHYYVKQLKEAGLVEHDGQRTLRAKSNGHGQ